MMKKRNVTGVAVAGVLALCLLVAACANPAGSTEEPPPSPPPSGGPWARVTEWHTFTSLDAAGAFLGEQELNTAETPYGIRLVGVNVAEFHNNRSGTVKDSLGKLFAAFQGCYVALDLSQCVGVNEGTALEKPHQNVFDRRPDKHKLVLLILPEGLENLTNCFSQNPSLAAVSLPPGLTTIGDQAFRDCSSLISVTLPAGLTAIGINAFYGCTALVSADLPASLTGLGDSAFRNAGITSVSVPAGVTAIPANCFFACPSLRAVTLAEGVTEIKENAFNQCPSLERVHLPRTLQFVRSGRFPNTDGGPSLTGSPFTGAENLVFTVTPGGAYEARENGRALVQTQGGGSLTYPVLVAAPSLSGSVTLSGYGSIAINACAGAPITHLVIGEGLTTIQTGAFGGCASLVSIDIPSTASTSVTIGFIGCPLTSITFRAEAVIAANASFAGYGRSNNGITVYVPANQVEAYQTATGYDAAWNNYYTIQAIPEPEA